MPADAERVRCDRCGARFASALTGGECPLCGLVVAAHDVDPLRAALEDPDRRMTLIVLGFTLANVLLLAVIALAISTATP